MSWLITLPLNTDAKIKSMSDVLMKKLTSMENRIMTVENRLMASISAMTADIANLRELVSGVVDKIGAFDDRVSGLEGRMNDVATEIGDLRARVKIVENEAVSSDLVMHGLPIDVDIGLAAKGILRKLGCEEVVVHDSFRVGTRADKRPKPVIIKLASSRDRVKLLKSLAKFRKDNKRNLSCGDVGVNGEGNLLLYESLSPDNRMILQTAIALKKKNLLHSAFSLRGSVFVRDKPDSDATKIVDLSALDKFAGA